jgi:hypothetical protein
MFHFYTYFEVTGFSVIFYGFLNKWMKRIILAMCIFFLIYSLLNITFWESLDVFNSNQRYVGGIVVIALCLLYFIKLFIDAKVERVEQDHLFWLSSILLIYTAGTLFLFILGKQVHTEGNEMYWDLHSVLNIILNIGFTITLWMGTRKSL